MRVNGFTLIEIVVVIALISIMSLVIAVAYPNLRNQQQLAIAEQQLQAQLREAQQMAINEERDPNCVAPIEEKNCSDIGLTIQGNQLIVFADIFEPAQNSYETGDFVLARHTLPAGVTIDNTSPTTFVFEGTPPTITLYADNTLVRRPVDVTLTLDSNTRNFSVLSYGQIESN